MRMKRSEALEDVVLAMRLNVELCEATEPVEKLDYRHVGARFQLKVDGKHCRAMLRMLHSR